MTFQAMPMCQVGVRKDFSLVLIVTERLCHEKKWCYIGHHRFLEPDHKWRTNRTSFNKGPERRPPPISLNGRDVCEQLSNCGNDFGKDAKGK